MELDFTSERPIFQQIAEGIEDAILTGAFPEGSQIPSTTDFSVRYKINPATALKGITLLCEEGVVYKKRGVGMFVSDGAVALLKDKRKFWFTQRLIRPMVQEAARLGFSQEELMNMVSKAFGKEERK